MNERFNALKRENVIKVFNAALERNNTSRTAISEDSGLSFVTVDKIVDILVDTQILKQTNSSKSAVIKRRSRLLCAKFRYWIAVYEILPSKFSFYICDLSLRCIKSFSYTPEDTIFIDDILNDFLKRTVAFAKRYANTDCCCGSGILVPGDYNETEDKVSSSSIPHFGAIRIRSFFSRFSFKTSPSVLSLCSSFVSEIKRTAAHDQMTYSLFLNNQSIFGSYVDPSSQSPIYINDLGKLKATCNKTFSQLVKTTPDPDLLFPPLCDILITLLQTVHITEITVCGYLYSCVDAVCEVLTNRLSVKCKDYCISVPKIKPMDLSMTAVRFISREIRNKWFEEEILGSTSHNNS